MAWESYIATFKTYYDGIAACGIFGHNGSTWAQARVQSEINYVLPLYIYVASLKSNEIIMFEPV